MPYPKRKLTVDVIHNDENEIECKLVPIAIHLMPFFRSFFDQMKAEGTWLDEDNWLRARRYFGWQEAAMLCNLSGDITEKIEEHKEENILSSCATIAMLVTVVSDGTISPTFALGACELLKNGLKEGSGTPSWDDALQLLLTVVDATIGKDANQLEPYTKALAELIGGSGVVSDVD